MTPVLKTRGNLPAAYNMTTNPSTSVVAKEADGTIQITFTVPWKEIEEKRLKALGELGKDVEVPGFRKGKAPLTKMAEKLPQDKVIEKTLSGILPKLMGEVISQNKLRIAIYPRFELISAREGENWQIRAITCEIPEFDLGDYKSEIKGALSTGSIWTPDKGEKPDKEEATSSEKEQKVIEVLLNKIKVTIPKVLIDEEVNVRLSKLLERLEKLGLTLEGYLGSIGKTTQSLREEYEKQAKNAISLELELSKIADKEALKVDEKDIDAAIQAGITDPNMKERLNTPEQRSLIESILKRRKALDFLTSLI